MSPSDMALTLLAPGAGKLAAKTAGKVIKGAKHLSQAGRGSLAKIRKTLKTVEKVEARGYSAGGVWSKPPVVRGEVIEKALGQNLPQNFKVIDKVKGGVATSIKSLDLNAASYQNAGRLRSTLKGYVDKVAGFTAGRTKDVPVEFGKDFTKRALEVAIPNTGNAAQRQVLKDIAEYAATKGVEFKAIVF